MSVCHIRMKSHFECVKYISRGNTSILIKVVYVVHDCRAIHFSSEMGGFIPAPFSIPIPIVILTIELSLDSTFLKENQSGNVIDLSN